MTFTTKSNACFKCGEPLAIDGRCWNPACSLAGINYKAEPLRETEENKSSTSSNRARHNPLRSFKTVESRNFESAWRIEADEHGVEHRERRKVEGSVRLLSGVKAVAPHEHAYAYAIYFNRQLIPGEYEKLPELLNIAIQGYHDSLAAQKVADGLQRAKDTVQRVHESRFAKPKDIPTNGNKSTATNHGLSEESLAAILEDAHGRDLTLREFRLMVAQRINLTIQYSLYVHEVDDLVLRMTGNDLESHWNNSPLR